MRKLTQVLWFAVGILSLSTMESNSAHAASSGASLNIEPIIGYERVQKLVPTVHSTTRMMYGARASAGLPLLSVETEYTRSSDTEEFPESSLSIKDTDDKLKLGVRSSFRASSIFSFQMRGGVQAKRTTSEVTTSGVTEKTSQPIVYKPYAGLGTSVRLQSAFELTGTVTVVFNDFPRMAKNEYQTALGFVVRVP